MADGMSIEVLPNREPAMANWALVLPEVIVNSLVVLVQLVLTSEILRTINALERLLLFVNVPSMAFKMFASLEAACTFGARKRFLLQVDVLHVAHQSVLSVESGPALAAFESVLESIAVAVDVLQVTGKMLHTLEGARARGAFARLLFDTMNGLQVL